MGRCSTPDNPFHAMPWSAAVWDNIVEDVRDTPFRFYLRTKDDLSPRGDTSKLKGDAKDFPDLPGTVCKPTGGDFRNIFRKNAGFAVVSPSLLFLVFNCLILSYQ